MQKLKHMIRWVPGAVCIQSLRSFLQNSTVNLGLHDDKMHDNGDVINVDVDDEDDGDMKMKLKMEIIFSVQEYMTVKYAAAHLPIHKSGAPSGHPLCIQAELTKPNSKYELVPVKTKHALNKHSSEADLYKIKEKQNECKK